MKKFVGQILIAILLILLFITCVFICKNKRYIGNYYERFSSPKQYSLILGSSMAAQDVDPSVINDCFEGIYKPIYNYSFSINTSPYGKTYTKSIKKKLKYNEDKNSLFILCVDPFSIANILSDVENGKRREDNSYLGQMNFVNISPNVEYLFRYSILNKDFYKQQTGNYVNEYGRHISLIDINEDSVEVMKRINDVILPDYYDNMLPNYHPSQERVEDLIELIDFLKNNGDVYMLRLPVGPEFSHILDSIYPDFDMDMHRLALQNNVSYINFKANNLDYRTTDGVHLYHTEGLRMTFALCDSINTKRLLK